MPHPEGEAEKQEFSGSAGAPIVVKAPVEMVEPTGAETFLDIDAVAGEALVREVASVFGSTPLFVPCDLLDIDALRAAMAQVRTLLGDAAVLVNNAANDHRQVLAEVTPAEFDWVIGVNLKHVFASQAVVPQNNCLAGGHAARRHSEDEGHKPDAPGNHRGAALARLSDTAARLGHNQRDFGIIATFATAARLLSNGGVPSTRTTSDL